MSDNTENTGVGTEQGIGTPPEDMDVEILNDTGDKSLKVAVAQGLLKDAEEVQEETETLEPTDSEDETEDETVESTDSDETEPVEVKAKGAFDAQKLKWQAKVRAKEEQINILMQELQKRSTPDAPPPVLAKTEPTLEDFGGNIQEYTKAILAHETAKIRQQAEFEVKANTFKQRQAEFKKVATDFDEVMEDSEDHPAAKQTCHELLNAIMEEQVGPNLQYYYAKNLDKLDQLNKMTPTKRLMEIGRQIERLESKSSNATAPKAKIVSNAPAPVKTTVSTGSAPKPTKSLYEMTADQVEAYLEAQERKNPALRRR